MRIHVQYIDPETGRLISDGDLMVAGVNKRMVMKSCQKLFGPCRGMDSDGTYRFLSGDGMLVKVSI